ncbi:MAG: hypothetical protein IJ664_04535 [Clostridia bacterium]|nr:hypothetical protein [Clostridia bacterium]
MIIMKGETLRDALLRGDREAVAQLLSTDEAARLEKEKNGLLRELTDAHLRGELPFCQLTAAAQAACAFPLENQPFIACCGGVAGNTGAVGKSHVLMLLRAWGMPTLDLGMDVSADEFLRAVTEHDLRFAVCVGFTAADGEFIGLLHQRALEHGIRHQFKLVLCGASLTAEALARLPLDIQDNRAAAVAEWMVDTWNG